MKTLKISEETHKRLTIFKTLYKSKSYDQMINNIITYAAEQQFEYGPLTGEEYKLINGD